MVHARIRARRVLFSEAAVLGVAVAGGGAAKVAVRSNRVAEPEQ
jgi:hypothetical protein